eukprot:5766136-Prymnesium_polylepis.2
MPFAWMNWIGWGRGSSHLLDTALRLPGRRMVGQDGTVFLFNAKRSEKAIYITRIIVQVQLKHRERDRPPSGPRARPLTRRVTRVTNRCPPMSNRVIYAAARTRSFAVRLRDPSHVPTANAESRAARGESAE